MAGRTSTAANTNTTGTQNTYLGADSGPGTVTQLDNTTAIGYGSRVTASNQVVIGNTSVTQTLLNGNVGIGTSTPSSALEISGSFTARGLSSAPSVSTANQGRIYFDYTTNKFRVSENGGAYVDLVGAGGGSGDINNGGNTTGSDISIGTNDLFGFQFKTNNTTAMTISSL